MPLIAASDCTKEAIARAVGANMRQLVRDNQRKPQTQKRTISQMRAIAFSEARKNCG